MKIFLTGGTGFIGSHVLKNLLNSNIEVVSHRRKESSSPKIPIKHSIKWLTKPVSKLDPKDFEGIDVLLHLASHSVQYPFDTLENNIKFNVVEPLEMFKKACQAGVTKFVIAGSCFEYGISGEKYDYIPTNAPLEPTNDYSTSKAMAYLAFRQMAESNQVGISYNRLFHVYGPGEASNRFWPSLREAAISGKDFDMTFGEQIRDFTHVEDMANKLINECKVLYRSQILSFKTTNFGSNNIMSIKEFASKYWEKFEAKGRLNLGSIPYRDNEVMRYVPLLK